MFSAIRSVHFVGIGGTAMASTAVAMHQKGIRVTGSDENVYPPMSTFLADRAVAVTSGYRETNLRHNPELVVIGNALSRGNPEVEAVLERKLRYCSLPELLKEFFIRGKRSLVVTGTHGKTTTTALLTWVFEHNGLNPSFLIGGIPNNLGQGARFSESEWFIIEGDEYDTAFFDKRSKFVHYLPEVAIVNNLEFDHADIFDNLSAVQLAFKRFFNLIPRNGLLLANGDDPAVTPVLENVPCPLRRFGFDPANDCPVSDIHLEPSFSKFTLDRFAFKIPLVGELNVRNAAGVAACALHCGLTDLQIQSAFDSFQGIKRRMETRGSSGGVTVIDDFGHHPTAIRETLRALRVKFPGRRLWAVFEPRSNTTRRNVFQSELGTALALADEVVVAEVSRIELLPVQQRLDPARLIATVQQSGRSAAYLPSLDAILDHVTGGARSGDVVCIFSNGGFGEIHEKLLQRLTPAADRPR